MPQTSRPFRLALLVTATLASALLSACGSSGSTSASTTTPAGTPTATATPTPTPSPTPRQPPTAAQLKQALLALPDLPTGFEVETSEAGNGDSNEDGDAIASSTDAKCAPLVKLNNAGDLKGSVANANASFSGGKDGPFISEDLEAMPSAAAAATVMKQVAAAVVACRKLTLRIQGVGRSTMRVSHVSAPALGDEVFAIRYTATSGVMAGFELNEVLVRVGDVLTVMDYLLADPDVIEGATTDAVAKVQKTLGAGATSA